MLFDTHVHLIYPDRLSYPWLKDAGNLNKSSTFDNYMRKAQRLGISDCLHMEVDIAEDQIKDETTLVQELMAPQKSILRGAISACRPEQTNFPIFLEWAQMNAAIKGFRRVLHVMPDELSQTDTFRGNIRRLTNTGLTFDICALPHQLPLAAELVDHCTEVTFILDHCGVPDIKGDNLHPWKESITELAKRQNIIAKISGIVAYANTDTWGLDNIRPYFDHTVASFGHERLVWGSDSPVCNLGGGLETWVAATHALTSSWSSADRAAFYHQNAAKLWG